MLSSNSVLPALLEPKELWVLPENYSVLVKAAAAFHCPKRSVNEAFGDDSQATMLCLVCGAMLCTNSYCCQVEIDKEDGNKKVRIGGFTQHVQK